MSAQVVLDASAVLALLFGEAGADVVAQACIGGALLSSASYAEASGVLVARGLARNLAEETLDVLGVEVVAFDKAQALETGWLKRIASDARLSLGDRCTLALARTLGLPVLTADPAWAGLAIGVEVRLTG